MTAHDHKAVSDTANIYHPMNACCYREHCKGLQAEVAVLESHLADAMRAVAEGDAELEKIRQRCEAAEAAVPTNWCDPLLTGPNSALGPHAGKWGCPDIERLLAGVRNRIKAAIDRAGGGES